MDGPDTVRATWQDGEGRECGFVSIDKETKQNAVNFKRDFLLHAAEEILRFKVNDQVQARVSEVDKGCMVVVRHKKRAWPTVGEKRAQQAERTRRSASPTSSQGVW